MKKLIIVGAGGFGREVAFLVERYNNVKMTYKSVQFIDDGYKIGDKISNYEVIGNINDLTNLKENVDVAIAIGAATTRKNISNLLMTNKYLNFPNLIDPSAIVDKKLIGVGNIICANNIFTVDYKIGNFNIINLSCTIGHDVNIKDYVTIYPGVNVSGNVVIDSEVELGTGSKIIQGKRINENSIIGAGAVVTKDIKSNLTVVGIPAKELI